MIQQALIVLGFWLILLASVLLIFLNIYDSYKNSKGKKRIVAGEIMKDFGIAIMVSAAFKWSLVEASYYIVVGMGALMVGLGARMKIDGKN